MSVTEPAPHREATPEVRNNAADACHPRDFEQARAGSRCPGAARCSRLGALDER
jgi:hypothetical protein